MFGVSFFPVYGIVVGINLKDSAIDGVLEEDGDYFMVQILFFVFGISFIYVRDTDG